MDSSNCSQPLACTQASHPVFKQAEEGPPPRKPGHTLICRNFQAWAFTRFQKPQQLGRARIACSCHVRQRAGPALLQAAAETTGIWGRKKAVRRVCHCKEVCLQEWPLAGRATVPRVLYSIGPRMSLRQRTILSKSLPAPACVSLTTHTFRTVEPQVVVLFGNR